MSLITIHIDVEFRTIFLSGRLRKTVSPSKRAFKQEGAVGDMLALVANSKMRQISVNSYKS